MLIQELERRREAADLTDAQFAQKFGVSRSYWSLVRSGKREVNTDFLSEIVKNYPDLAGHALIFLQQKVTTDTVSQDSSHTAIS